MKALALSTMCVAIVFLPSSLLVRGDVYCGYVRAVLCPGCAASVPADSTCYCGVTGEGCHCVKQSGGVQNGTIVICYTETFEFNYDPDGPVVVLGPTRPCQEIKKCTKGVKLGALNCAVYDEGDCYGPPEPCGWYVWIANLAQTYQQGQGECEGGVPPT
ncbi:MAG: hypothetical protein KKB50_06275 [Planctomycetes bacterium]|nr:hypothetical protein [Planctomycetota bacterium]